MHFIDTLDYDTDNFYLLLLLYLLLLFYLTLKIVENNGVEPLTPCVQGRCSSQLS